MYVGQSSSFTLIDRETVSSPSSSELSYPQPGPQWRSSCDTSSKFCAAWGGMGAAWADHRHERSTRYQCNPENWENSIFSFSHFDGFSVEENLLKVKVDFIKFQEHFLSLSMKYFYFPFHLLWEGFYHIDLQDSLFVSEWVLHLWYPLSSESLPRLKWTMERKSQLKHNIRDWCKSRTPVSGEKEREPIMP